LTEHVGNPETLCVIRSFWIKGIGLSLLLMMAVRVSITPGVRHQHEHGDHPHSHHHHSHGPHSHAHEPAEPQPSSEAATSTAHIHIFILGWEFTFNSPYSSDETPNSRTEGIVAASESAPHLDAPPSGPLVTSATAWGTLIQWIFDIRSPAPPAKVELPQGVLTHPLSADETAFAARDRDKPLSPPPEPGLALQTVC
jgi:hypothetical protein